MAVNGHAAEIQPESDAKNPVVAWQNEPKSKAPAGLFFDREALKKDVRTLLQGQEAYSVFQYYKDESESCWPRIAKHSVFENVTLAVIAINAVYIAIDTDWNKAEPLTPKDTRSLQESAWPFQMMEHFFCVYFTFEWIVRFASFRVKSDGRKDAWFVFDSLLVFMMVMETWVLILIMWALGGGGFQMGGTSILRLFRLLRLSRLMRMLRSLPELMILIKGMVTAMKSVVYVLGLLVIVTYIFAIAFTQLAVGTPTIGEDYFANVAHSMYSLLIYATLLDDLIAFTDSLRFQSPALLVLCFIYIGLAALTIMNMLIGVLCEVVSAVAVAEKEAIQTENLSAKMREIVETLDENFNGKISYDELTKMVKIKDVLHALQEVEVDPVALLEFAELSFFEDGELVLEDGAPRQMPFDEFMEMVLDLRDSNTAIVKDLLNLWMKIKGNTNKEILQNKTNLMEITQNVTAKTESIQARTERIQGQLCGVLGEMRKLTKAADL